MRSNYKTTECRYYHQGRCNRGDQCTFRHGPSDPKASLSPSTTWTVPLPAAAHSPPPVLWTIGPPHQTLTIHTTVDYSYRRYQYYIQGPTREECLRYYEDTILREYPTNPYFTMIHSEGPNFIHVTRSTTSD